MATLAEQTAEVLGIMEALKLDSISLPTCILSREDVAGCKDESILGHALAVVRELYLEERGRLPVTPWFATVALSQTESALKTTTRMLHVRAAERLITELRWYARMGFKIVEGMEVKVTRGKRIPYGTYTVYRVRDTGLVLTPASGPRSGKLLHPGVDIMAVEFVPNAWHICGMWPHELGSVLAGLSLDWNGQSLDPWLSGWIEDNPLYITWDNLFPRELTDFALGRPPEFPLDSMELSLAVRDIARRELEAAERGAAPNFTQRIHKSLIVRWQGE